MNSLYQMTYLSKINPYDLNRLLFLHAKSSNPLYCPASQQKYQYRCLLSGCHRHKSRTNICTLPARTSVSSPLCFLFSPQFSCRKGNSFFSNKKIFFISSIKNCSIWLLSTLYFGFSASKFLSTVKFFPFVNIVSISRVFRLCREYLPLNLWLSGNERAVRSYQKKY